MIFYGYSKTPLWWRCKKNENGVVIEKDVTLGFCRWNNYSTETKSYFDKLELDENDNPKWVRYLREGTPLRLPETSLEELKFPDGVPTRLSMGCRIESPADDEDEVDAFFKIWNGDANKLFVVAFEYKIAAKFFYDTMREHSNIPEEIWES